MYSGRTVQEKKIFVRFSKFSLADLMRFWSPWEIRHVYQFSDILDFPLTLGGASSATYGRTWAITGLEVVSDLLYHCFLPEEP